jgi:hypothetical protein
VPTGWTAFNEGGATDIGSENSGGGQYTTNNPLAPPADGNQYCYVNMFNPAVTGGIYQDIGAVQPNTIYTLTVAIGSRNDRLNSPGIISLINGTDNTGTILATGGGLPATQNTWQDYSATLTTGATVSGDLTIALSAQGNGTTIQADFDNVRLAITLVLPPEPADLSAVMVASNNLVMNVSNLVIGRNYVLQSTTNLAAPVWLTETNFAATQTTFSLPNNPTHNLQKYYRLVGH